MSRLLYQSANPGKVVNHSKNLGALPPTGLRQEIYGTIYLLTLFQCDSLGDNLEPELSLPP